MSSEISLCTQRASTVGMVNPRSAIIIIRASKALFRTSDETDLLLGTEMTKIHQINCGTLLVPNFSTVVCHCLLLEDESGLALVDTGIGLLDVQTPVERLVGQRHFPP